MLVPDLMRNPSQLQTSEEPFVFEYRGQEYSVDPQASYDISGLVVSHNNILAWWDIYHDEDSVDIKDICLIWGDNADQDIYNNMRFWNESVSCHFQSINIPTGQRFKGDALSNNHLLSDDPEVREKIKEVRTGDQIRMKGYLINYHRSDIPESVRKSSLTRSDTAGFACEVMFVTQLDFLKKAPRFWHRIYDFTHAWLLTILMIKIFTMLIFPWLEFKLT